MSATREQPGWLTEPCPSWCDEQHDDQDLIDDRRHHSAFWVVPVIQPVERYRHLSHRLEASELTMLTFRDVADRETWVAIANDQQRLELTLESALRLQAGLLQLLDAVTVS